MQKMFCDAAVAKSTVLKQHRFLYSCTQSVNMRKLQYFLFILPVWLWDFSSAHLLTLAYILQTQPGKMIAWWSTGALLPNLLDAVPSSTAWKHLTKTPENFSSCMHYRIELQPKHLSTWMHLPATRHVTQHTSTWIQYCIFLLPSMSAPQHLDPILHISTIDTSAPQHLDAVPTC